MFQLEYIAFLFFQVWFVEVTAAITGMRYISSNLYYD